MFIKHAAYLSLELGPSVVTATTKEDAVEQQWAFVEGKKKVQ